MWSFLNIKEYKEESWNLKKEEITQWTKIWVNTLDINSPFEFCKFYLITETKNVTVSNWFWMYVEEIFKIIMLQRKGKKHKGK